MNAGTDLSKLNGLEGSSTGTSSLIPTGVVMGQVIALGPAAAAANAQLILGSWILAKAPHSNFIYLDALTSDFICFGEHPPPIHYLLARYANIAAQSVSLVNKHEAPCVGVVGLGPLGHMCVRLAAELKGIQIFGADPHEYRRLACKHADLPNSEYGESLPKGQSFDAIVFAAPLVKPIDLYLQQIREGGRAILLSVPHDGRVLLDMSSFVRRALSLEAIHEKNVLSHLTRRGSSLISNGTSVLASMKFGNHWPLNFSVSADLIELELAKLLKNKSTHVYLRINWLSGEPYVFC